MESLTNKVLALIPRNNNVNGVTRIVKLVKDMRGAGLLSTPTYTLPMVDTLGKTKPSTFKSFESRQSMDTTPIKKKTDINCEASGW